MLSVFLEAESAKLISLNQYEWWSSKFVYPREWISLC